VAPISAMATGRRCWCSRSTAGRRDGGRSRERRKRSCRPKGRNLPKPTLRPSSPSPAYASRSARRDSGSAQTRPASTSTGRCRPAPRRIARRNGETAKRRNGETTGFHCADIADDTCPSTEQPPLQAGGYSDVERPTSRRVPHESRAPAPRTRPGRTPASAPSGLFESRTAITLRRSAVHICPLRSRCVCSYASVRTPGR
jgi:hypothetical protein